MWDAGPVVGAWMSDSRDAPKTQTSTNASAGVDANRVCLVGTGRACCFRSQVQLTTYAMYVVDESKLLTGDYFIIPIPGPPLIFSMMQILSWFDEWYDTCHRSLILILICRLRVSRKALSLCHNTPPQLSCSQRTYSWFWQQYYWSGTSTDLPA